MAKKLNDFLKEQFSKVIDEKQLIDLLKSNRLNIKDIAAKFEVPVPVVWDAIDKLTDKKIMVNREEGEYYIDEHPSIGAKKALNPDLWEGEWLRFGYVSDNHLCSHFERLDVLNLAYDTFAREGVKVVLNGGNWIDGEARFNKNEIHTTGFGRQMAYAVKNYPYREGIETWFVSGDDHEGWYNQREGVNSGDFFQMLREESGKYDLKHLGYVEADINLNAGSFENPMWLRVMHPGGGSAYATSYTGQKIVESFQPGEKPHLLFLGHYHKYEKSFIRGVHVWQMACTMDQSIFMRKKKIEAHVGFGIAEFCRNEDGYLTRVRDEFTPVYDKGFYEGKTKYWK
jgi:hypothetical protein